MPRPRSPRRSRRPRSVRRARARGSDAAPARTPARATAARQTQRRRRRCARAAGPLPPPRAERTPPEDVPTYEAVYGWLRAHLPRATYPKPACKRLAALVSGLLVKRDCTLGALAAAIDRLDVSAATAESIERRLRRVLRDERLDPGQVLPALFAAVLPALLAALLDRHAASARHAGRHHTGRLLVRVVADDTGHTDRVHLLVVGLAYRGLVVPLLVRTWQQNAPLPEGEYWTQLHALLHDVQALLPAPLRDHVLLVADRAFGVPRMLDLLAALGWHWLLRVQGQARVLLRDGTTRALRSLVPCPGTTWFGQFDPRPGAAGAGPPLADAGAVGVAGVFKAAGWRGSQVVAAWARGQDEPWLLLTSLAPTADCLLEYARRWGIERLFLSWKSHGWDLEACGVHDPVRLGRLLSGLVLATLWRLAAGVLDATTRLADLRRRAARRHPPPRVVRQLPLPLDADLQPRPGHLDAARPFAAKRSLFTRGTDLWEAIAGRRETPPLLWQFPDWDAPTWAAQARQVYSGLTS